MTEGNCTSPNCKPAASASASDMSGRERLRVRATSPIDRFISLSPGLMRMAEGRPSANTTFSHHFTAGNIRNTGIHEPMNTLVSKIDQNALYALVSGADTPQKTMIEKIGPLLASSMEKAEITTPLRISHFLAQIFHGSRKFRTLKHRVNNSGFRYSNMDKYEGTTSLYYDYQSQMRGRDPKLEERIKYCARGLLPVNGFNFYFSMMLATDINLVRMPDRLFDHALAVDVACKYWAAPFDSSLKNLNSLADQDDLESIMSHLYHKDDIYFKIGRDSLKFALNRAKKYTNSNE